MIRSVVKLGNHCYTYIHICLYNYRLIDLFVGAPILTLCDEAIDTPTHIHTRESLHESLFP